MAGIYIHIPFCRQACYYCNFHFSTSLRDRGQLVSALGEELRLRTNYLGDSGIQTLYLGGGTPSQLPVDQIAFLLDLVRKNYPLAPQAEITLEANPDDIRPEMASAWRDLGINRLSLGIQSFRDQDLKWMHRAHDGAAGLESIRILQQAGFTNYSIDLIYGLPGLEPDDWRKELEQVAGLGIPHLSCYALTVEPGTALNKFIRDGNIPSPDQDLAVSQFEILMDWAPGAGYAPYEISNLCRPGFASIHNGNYWKGVPYLGIGPSAHSFNGSTRQWNISRNAAYAREILEGRIPCELEVLSTTMQVNEYIMTRLRTERGLDLDEILLRWGPGFSRPLEERTRKWIREGKMQRERGRVYLSRKGKLWADSLAAELFF